MRPSPSRQIEVWADWDALAVPTLMGVLSASPARGREVFSFAYDERWLQTAGARALDPALRLFSGRQYPASGKESFGLFLDSAPDRWGRFLMDRRETRAARDAGRPRNFLLESDYLLGVFDGNRVGALRFRTEPNGPFLDDNAGLASPPWTSLRALEHACRQIEQPGAESQPEYGEWLRMLIAPGGSLGGARPKAGVRDETGRLWIAKFPSRHDSVDFGAWEHVVYTLAFRAGIDTAPAKVRRFASEHHTFLIQRFDRTTAGTRRHFASAMTLLGRSDGDDASAGASYLEFAEFLAREGADVDRDLEQLWRRIVFFICVSNVDDHLQESRFPARPWSGLAAFARV
jgi:serine/threonine-protein kinase HipA